MRKTFLEYLGLAEASENTKKAATEVKLSDDSDFKPFVIDAEHHPNLRVIVKAFSDSGNVPYPGPDGYGPDPQKPQTMTVMDPSKGATTPKIKKKTIYLTGGAVADHLEGETPNDYDLATDATPDEIRLILRHAGFTETKPQTGKHAPIDKKYDKHPETTDKNKIFYAKGWDRGGREFVIGAKVNGEEFEIATFRKDSKGGDGRTPDKMEFAGIDEDSARRDFTYNAMYIPLTNTDGPNSKLIDLHGGVHHLRAGETHFVGNPKERLEEDQLRAMRYIRNIASRGKNTKISDDVKSAIENIKDLSSVSRERIREEFLKGLKKERVDVVKYIKHYKDLGLLNTVFPDLQFKLDVPEDYSEKKEPRLALAWLLRNNAPEKVKEVLENSRWESREVSHIVHLIKLAKWMSNHDKNPELFFDKFAEMKKDFHQVGMVPSMAREWGRMNKLPEDVLHKFVTHEMDSKNPTNFKTKGYVDQEGRRTVNPDIIQHLGRMPQGKDFGDSIKAIETEKFRKNFGNNKEQHEF